MKKLVPLVTLLFLSGCQLKPVVVAPEELPVSETVSIQPPEVEPEESEPVPPFVLDEQATSLAAWLDYKQQILLEPEPESARLNALTTLDEVALLQLALHNLHPDMPYVNRFRVQTQLTEMVSTFPPRLAALFSWDLTFNQKLLEAESAVSALTRLNAQQQDTIERLQKTNRDLQKKIDALTQIEAELNQPSTSETNNGGQ